MSSINICFFMGNLTRKPELKFTPKGMAVCEVGLALNHAYTTDQGQKREEVTFIDVECWGKTAEIIAEHLDKGSLAHFQCRTKLEQWDDRDTGKKRQRIKFVCERFTFMPNGKKNAREEYQGQEEEGEYEPRSTPPPQQRAAPPQQRTGYGQTAQRPPAPRPPPAPDPELDVPADDDVPF